jgi:hypothetical protein
MTDDELLSRFRTAYWAVVHNLDVRRLQVWEERGLTATISGLVDKLVRAGLVERRQNADDRRVIPLWLTSEGQATAGEIGQGNRAYLAALAEQLGDDLGPVTATLERLAEAIERLPAASETDTMVGAPR